MQKDSHGSHGNSSDAEIPIKVVKAFDFPLDPYPVQKGLQGTILNVLRDGRNPCAVVEAPTGTGKTIAALSGVLTFQREIQSKYDAGSRDLLLWQEQRYNQRCDFLARHYSGRQQVAEALSPVVVPELVKKKRAQERRKGQTVPETESELQDRFRSELAIQGADQIHTTGGAGSDGAKVAGKKRPRALAIHRDKNKPSAMLEANHSHPNISIFYCCRTHSQIKQAAQELKKFNKAFDEKMRQIKSGVASDNLSRNTSGATTSAAPAERQIMMGGPVESDQQHNQLSAAVNYRYILPDNLIPPQALKMNIMGSRERYCIHSSVIAQLQPVSNKYSTSSSSSSHGTSGTAPGVRGRQLRSGTNDLGEICDKLVEVGQCEYVQQFLQTADETLAGYVKGVTNGASTRKENVWDIEDLVANGRDFTKGCPYYASREMVFHADISFCTYNYLLDPIIRAETKFEHALANNSVVVFDEAHNLVSVCQEGFSCSLHEDTMNMFIFEFGRMFLADSNGTTFVPTYPRGFTTTRWTLIQLFQFGYSMVENFKSGLAKIISSSLSNSSGGSKGGLGNGGSGATIMVPIEDLLQHMYDSTCPNQPQVQGGGGGVGMNNRVEYSKNMFISLLNDLKTIISTLGVTFNPFDFPIHFVASVKRYLLVMCAMVKRSSSFSMWWEWNSDIRGGGGQGVDEIGGGGGGGRANTQQNTASFMQKTTRLPTGNGSSSAFQPAPGRLVIRCLDATVGLQHLLSAVDTIILMSGTLTPFDTLQKELDLPIIVQSSSNRNETTGTNPSPLLGRALLKQGGGSPAVHPTTPLPCNALVGSHVVDLTPEYGQAMAVAMSSFTRGEGNAQSPLLRCTFSSYQDKNFMQHLASGVYRLAKESQCGGGALCFVPNYSIATELVALLKKMFPEQHQLPILLEPKSVGEFDRVFEQYKKRCVLTEGEIITGPEKTKALMVAVHRGKLSEGIDFTDGMARLVMSVGIPFQPLLSPEVKEQRRYSGERWYTVDALRAVNQALGRCIRHRNDYGAMIILEERLIPPQQKTATSSTSSGSDTYELLSSWMKPHLQHSDSIEKLTEEIRNLIQRQHGLELERCGGLQGFKAKHGSIGNHHAGDGFLGGGAESSIPAAVQPELLESNPKDHPTEATAEERSSLYGDASARATAAANSKKSSNLTLAVKKEEGPLMNSACSTQQGADFKTPLSNKLGRPQGQAAEKKDVFGVNPGMFRSATATSFSTGSAGGSLFSRSSSATNNYTGPGMRSAVVAPASSSLFQKVANPSSSQAAMVPQGTATTQTTTTLQEGTTRTLSAIDALAAQSSFTVEGFRGKQSKKKTSSRDVNEEAEEEGQTLLPFTSTIARNKQSAEIDLDDIEEDDDNDVLVVE